MMIILPLYSKVQLPVPIYHVVAVALLLLAVLVVIVLAINILLELWHFPVYSTTSCNILSKSQVHYHLV